MAKAAYLLVFLVAAGCGGSHVAPGDDGGTDGGAPADGGPGGEPCGPVTCGPGLTCCNASCGICTLPGEGCPAIACVDGGVTDGGPCETCPAPPPGCRYEGASCASCGELVCDGVCGGLVPGGPSVCDPSQYCDYPEGCGFDDGTGVCLPRPDTCPRIYAPVCGCDGNTYANDCVAAMAGVDSLHDGECTSACDPMDARGVGPCDAFFGYAWNGVACVGLSGCSCEGVDCVRTYSTPDACEAAYAHCRRGETCGTFAGLTCRDGQWCDYGGGSCGFDDGAGICRPRPTMCPFVYAPVCGCDGVTYNNDCEAGSAGVDWLHRGECEGPPPPPPPSDDCRVTGCPVGSYCSACLSPDGVSYVCIPDGAAC